MMTTRKGFLIYLAALVFVVFYLICISPRVKKDQSRLLLGGALVYLHAISEH